MPLPSVSVTNLIRAVSFSSSLWKRSAERCKLERKMSSAMTREALGWGGSHSARGVGADIVDDFIAYTWGRRGRHGKRGRVAKFVARFLDE